MGALAGDVVGVGSVGCAAAAAGVEAARVAGAAASRSAESRTALVQCLATTVNKTKNTTLTIALQLNYR